MKLNNKLKGNLKFDPYRTIYYFVNDSLKEINAVETGHIIVSKCDDKIFSILYISMYYTHGISLVRISIY